MNGLDSHWQAFRDQFPVNRSWAYLDNAAVAPLSRPASDAISRWSMEAAEKGATEWPAWSRRVEETRRLAARMFGADADEIAFVPNTSSGISLVAEGFPWQAGDNVVILDNEFPANVYPWLNLARRRVETRTVATIDGRVDVDRIVEAFDSQTRILSISWVGYVSGWRIHLPEVIRAAHDHGVLVFLDAIQGLGVFPLDAQATQVDFFAADGHKWLISPEGAGVLFIRRPHLDLLQPLGVGWNSVVHSHDYSRLDFNIKKTASRYEGGSLNMVGILALGASLELLANFGLTKNASPIAERILKLNSLACDRLAGTGAQVIRNRPIEHQSGIVSFDLPGQNLAAVRAHCRESGVILSCRGNRLRISPHAYADESDIDRLIESLQQLGTLPSNSN